MPDRLRILAGKIADARSERAAIAVTVEGGVIAGLEPLEKVRRPLPGDLEATDALLLPGFMDIHIHGGAGRNIMEGTAEAVNAISIHLARHGVTGFLATTVTSPWNQHQQALAAGAAAMRAPENGRQGAAVLGCHLEGPYINPKKRGAQPEAYILPPDVDDFRRQVGDDLAAVRVMTLAPEMPGALEMIRFLAASCILASIGHTNATYEEVCAGIDAGARHLTHCFNAMRPLDSREPGGVGAALSRPELTAELIWDNIHVHPASCRGLIYAKGPGGVILISDGIPGAGMPEGYSFSLVDLDIVCQNGAARLPDGTLAGSLLTLDTAFQNANPFTLSERAAMTSYNAARALGLGYKKGLIAPGYDADLVLLNPDGSVRQTFVTGRSVFSR
ncbi:MAG TPA: N-acetylglucosamine-6-phosphate deacetylase [Chthonomonadaceae bacterium]|nr:N-acetylglucosamine-6-phosphate deacetylase [Chthonomonadaceae bacterium]